MSDQRAEMEMKQHARIREMERDAEEQRRATNPPPDFEAIADELAAALGECSDMLRSIARHVGAGFECLETADNAMEKYEAAKK